DGYRDLEGTYVFPVPGGGIRDVKLIVDGKTLEGRLLGKEEAKKLYQQYVIERRDASLLEYVGRDAFSSSIVLPKGKVVKVVITYEQIIQSSGGVYSYMYPLSPERYSTKPIDPVNITVKINAPGTLGFIYSPTHNITVEREGKGKATATYYEEKVLPDKDFQLYYGITEREYDVKLLAHKTGESGYFLLFIYPSIVNQTSLPKDVVFVIDTSGSMEGVKIEQAKRALKYGLDKLNGVDRFDVIAFSSTHKAFSGKLEGVASIKEAKEFIDNLIAEGSTNIQDSLLAAVQEFQNDSRVHIVVLLTDGRDTTGHSRAEIIKSLSGKSGFKVFVFGVGDDADFELLDKLANEFGDGIPTYIKNEAELEVTLKSFYDRIATPLLSNVKLRFDYPVYDVLPRRIPDVFLGTQLVVAGRYNGSGRAVVHLEGFVGESRKEWTYEVYFPQSSSNSFVERTWALRRVGYLLDQIMLEGETPQLKQEVTSLATKYGIPTPYTSYLVVSPEGTTRKRDVGIMPMAAAVGGGAFGVTSAYKSAESTTGIAQYVEGTKAVGDKTFVSVGGVWKDTACGEEQPTRTVSFGSDEYFELINNPETANYLSVGEDAILCSQGEVIQVVPSETTQTPGITQTNATGGGTPELSSIILIPVSIALAFFVVFILLNILKKYSPQEGDEAELHKVLSSETRLQILNTLAEGERTPTDISSKLNKSKATIVEHLDKLREAELVEKIEVDGRKWVFYKLTPRGKSLIKKGG
ncbi:MAG: VWA domain-containing protein, partial [Candidatus Micrarchaeia archaeon]